MKPFNITLEITEATQAHQIISQLLRVYPTLRLTITIQDETKSITPGPPQTDRTDACIRAYVAACICSIYPRADPSRFRDAIDKAHSNFVRLDSDSDPERTRSKTNLDAADTALTAARCSTPAAAAPPYAWKPGEHTEAAADAAAAERAHRGDNHEDAGYDDTNSNGR